MREKFQIDAAHTVLGFSARHLGVSNVRGHFGKFEGSFEADRGDLSNATGEVVIDVSSITTGTDQRDAHLKSADFFEADKYPTATYRLTQVTPESNSTYRVTGELTIKDVTRTVVLSATLEGETDSPFVPGAKVVAVSATGEINRMDFGLNWDGLAGAIPLASHNIKLSFELELVATEIAEAAA